jgi:hypothetical protein
MLKLSDRRKQAKLQWLQNISQMNGDNMDNVRPEASRTFRTKRTEYLKDKINEPEACNTGTHYWNTRNQGHYWNIVATMGTENCCNTLLQHWELISLLKHIVATTVTEVIVETHFCNNGNRCLCWLTTMISDHVIETMALDTIVVFDTIVAFRVMSTVALSCFYQLGSPLASLPMMWREEHLWNFSVLQRVVRLSSLTRPETVIQGEEPSVPPSKPTTASFPVPHSSFDTMHINRTVIKNA